MPNGVMNLLESALSSLCVHYFYMTSSCVAEQTYDTNLKHRIKLHH